MLTYNDLPVEDLVWSVIAPSGAYSDFVTFVKHFPKAAYERRHDAIKRACELHTFGNSPAPLYPHAYAALEEIAREAESADIRQLVFFQLGKMTQQGFGTEQDTKKAIAYYEQAIAAGEVRSLVNLGIHYEFTDKSAEGKARARELFQRAVDLGEPQSLVCLADLIEDDNDSQKSRLVEQSIDLGCAFAMVRLSNYFRHGKGGKAKDLEQADAWMIRAAKAGHAEANFFVGGNYEHGERCEVQPQLAADWYRRGEAELDPRCMAALGVMTLYGVGVEQDKVQARSLLLRAALLGDSAAQRRLALELLWATESGLEHAQGFQWLKQCADDGNLKACENLYQVYMHGRGTEKNPEKALFYVRQAAEEGLPDAQWQLATAHWFDGDGIAADHDEAFKWLSICATQGDQRGICFLGHAYQEGIGCKPDPEQAVALFKEAAAMDYPPAIQALGRCYFNGDGITKDPAKGIALLRDAANRGESRAMTDIGLALLNGEHLLTNYAEALKWFHRAAEKGERNAMYFIGRMHEEGDGVEQSTDEARRWFAMAAAKGHQRALSWLSENTPAKPEWLAQMISGAAQTQTSPDR